MMSDASPPGPADESSSPGPDAEQRSDPFAPPARPCECYCLHCNRVFMSDQIWFQRFINGRDSMEGMWMCPTHNCDGAGFTFDIFPTDQNHPANESWHDGGDGDAEDGEAGEGGEYDPAEPKYAELDEQFGDDDDDIEGEEWKHGLEPGERPPDPPWVQEARDRWEQEQKKYDAPDERPRVIDRSNEPEPPPRPPGVEGDDSDIPF